MEENFSKYIQQNEKERIERVEVLAKNLNIDFKEAEKIIDNLCKEFIQPGEMQIRFEAQLKVENTHKKVSNIVSVDTVAETIVDRTIREFNLYFQLDNKQIDSFNNLVKEELKNALRKIKAIDVVEVMKQNKSLKKAYLEIMADRNRLKSALEGTICGMVIYADTKGNPTSEARLESFKKRAGEALRLSDLIE